MEQYTVLTKGITEIDGNNKFTATLVYAYIKSRENYELNVTSRLTYPNIAKNIKVAEGTVENIVPALISRRALFTKVDGRTMPDEKGEIHTHNTYYFASSYPNYFYINNAFFSEDISSGIASIKEANKVKGLLLQLKAVCINETNKYISRQPYKGGVNISELSRLLNTDRDTLTRLLKLAVELKQVKYIPKGILITNRHIIPDYIVAHNNRQGKPLLTAVYHTIYNWCLDNGIIPPDRNDTIHKAGNKVKRSNEILSRIAAKFNVTDKDIVRLADASHVSANVYLQNAIETEQPFIHCYLPYVLSRRLVTKPEYITLEYIASTLNIPPIDSEDEDNPIIML